MILQKCVEIQFIDLNRWGVSAAVRGTIFVARVLQIRTQYKQNEETTMIKASE